MSHGDQLAEIPAGFEIIAKTASAPMAAIQNESKQIYGIQFHPEVTHTPKGKVLLENFVVNICGVSKGGWSMNSFIDTEIERIRSIVGPTAQVIGAVSGGVDSTVAAKLMHMAIGDRFHAILVDNGVMRMNECADSLKLLRDKLQINLHLADASELFLNRLKGVTDPEKKRKIIGNTFIEVFEAEAARIEAHIEQEGKGKIEFLLQGTLYPDVIESVSFKGPSATIKTHHVSRVQLC
jgi:GMP synthase (glutamine-hydrolysing)